MRTVIEGLPSPHPIGPGLPALYQADPFAQRLSAGFDDCLAPVLATLDCLDCYLDPDLAPPDFVDWLALWVGLELEQLWTTEQRRRLVAEAVGLYRIRGTAAGLAGEVGLATGVIPEIEETGGCAWSASAGAALPGRLVPELVVRLRVADPAAVDAGLVERIVAAAKPAHVTHRVEVVVDPTRDGLEPGQDRERQ